MKVPLDVWEKKGKELFGEDKQDWVFVCPVCKKELSVNRAKKEFPEVAGKGWQVECECIGRYTDKVKCDWCAYGLLRGPLIVYADGQEMTAFDFSGEPFTRNNADIHRRKNAPRD